MSPEHRAASDLLTADEIALLRRALLEWGGPARCSDELAVGMGFAGLQDLLDQCRRLRAALAEDAPVAPVDWARVLLATEIVFVSDLAGSGFEWSTTTGLSDESSLQTLRAIQRKLARTVRPYYGTAEPSARNRVLSELDQSTRNLILSVDEDGAPGIPDAVRDFIEEVTFADPEDILSALREALADDWMALPVWARNLAYRLACLQRPDDPALLREAAADLLSFGPDWDETAEALKARAAELESQSKCGFSETVCGGLFDAGGVVDVDLGLRGQAVARICFDATVTILTSADCELRIETEAVIQVSTEEHVAFDPQSPAAAAAHLVRLARDVITEAHVGEGGDLVVAFESGMNLTVRADDAYEAWGLVGPGGRRVICMPGGEVGVWSDDGTSDVRDSFH
ncbi:DUF6188 family protein [Streptomyces cavernae]|uniref:DUF6188 family protein n=1 Tax=Streptomyces cavernae TaxID=2259034 RepID=UPI001EE3F048|nr:DUF6188 family protein [Streptomyces cavernae]